MNSNRETVNTPAKFVAYRPGKAPRVPGKYAFFFLQSAALAVALLSTGWGNDVVSAILFSAFLLIWAISTLRDAIAYTFLYTLEREQAQHAALRAGAPLPTDEQTRQRLDYYLSQPADPNYELRNQFESTR